MVPDLDSLDGERTLALLGSVQRRRRQAELDDLDLAAHWAALHSTPPEQRHPHGDKLVRLGGEGTPKVRELCLAELGIARDVHTLAARALVADVLDLQHRLPQVWAFVRDLAVEAWLARKIASATRSLSGEQAAWVDARLAPLVADLSAGRVLTMLEALVIEADSPACEERLEKARRERHVSLGRTDEHGLRLVIARIAAGDAAFVDATADRVADILAVHPERRSADLPDDPNRCQLRAEAFGWLGRPAQLLQLLAAHLDVSRDAGEDLSPAVTPDPAALAPFVNEFTAADLSRLGPGVALFVHLHEDTLLEADGASPLARVEGIGPVLLRQLVSLLGHTHVTVTPVVDCRETAAVDAYELPDRLRTRIRLRSPAEAFPHSATITGIGRRRVDLDHPTPYQPQGPPGQTGDHNAAPLTRSRHRAKTHLAYRVIQLAPGVWLWRTPHGLWRLVHPDGTTVIDEETAAWRFGDDELTPSCARLWWRHCRDAA
ncbi:hypothetical protein ACT8ZV_00245 [Nocardioides sp. MAHUQ-72]|uniref:hypothetical protein n=1 Tax=unclassified Nocardioides TaxID=2615069 RepID=UPI00361BF9F2